MGLNDVASADRIHIGFFGLRNSGKSSLVNAVTGQALSLVSDVKGTTTDPVRKSMELLPLGPVVIIDTPGIDDEGALGEMRARRARKELDTVDVAVLVTEAGRPRKGAERELVDIFRDRKIPYVVAYNKCDLREGAGADASPDGKDRDAGGWPEGEGNLGGKVPDAGSRSEEEGKPGGEGLSADASPSENGIFVSALRGTNIHELKEMIGRIAKGAGNDRRIVADLLEPGDLVVLVVPIDSAAPKGRLILPQQQTIRDVLDAGAMAVVARDCELRDALAGLSRRPRLVITDSQAFGRVSRDTPEDIPLTSFSILFARYKGNLAEAVRGAAMLDRLRDGDTVLISEGCTHHRQCDDIGTVKLPAWVSKYAGKELSFAFTSGGEFPEDLSPYRLVIHCGGCMLNERQMRSRVAHAQERGVPITNYGIAIAQMNGILRRSLEPFPELRDLLPDGE